MAHTMGKGGTKEKQIKAANVNKAKERMQKVMNRGEELTGIEKVKFDIAELKRRISAAEFDMKAGRYGSWVSDRILDLQKQLNEKEELLYRLIDKLGLKIFICKDCKREFECLDDKETHECLAKISEAW